MTGAVQAGSVEVAVKANLDNYTKGMADAKQRAQGFFSETQRQATAMGGSFGRLGQAARSATAFLGPRSPLILGVVAIGNALLNASTRAKETAQNFRLLENRISVIGHETGQTAGSLQRITDEVARATGISVQSIRDAASELLRFRLPPGTMREILDLSARLELAGFGPLAQSARRLAESIKDPVAALQELQNQGVRFSEQTVEQIRNLTSLDRRWQAQALLIDGVKKATEGVRAETPGLWSELAGFAEDLATAATRAVFDLSTLERAARNAASSVRGWRDWITGRSELGRFKDRGVEQLTKDVTDLSIALAKLRSGASLDAELRQRITEVLPGAFSGSWTSMLPSMNLVTKRIEDGLALVQEALALSQAAQQTGPPANPGTSGSGGGRDYLADLQNRLALERDLLFLNEAQAQVESTLYDLRQRGVTLAPQVEESLRGQILATERLKDQMQGLTQAIESLVSNSTDAIIEFAKTGKFEFKRLADSIIEDMLRIAMKAFVMKPIMNMVPGLGGSLFGGSSIIGASGIGSGGTTAISSGSLFGFAGGGQFKVPGSGGGDRPTLVGLAPGELVTITPQHQVQNNSQGPRVTVINRVEASKEMQVETRERRGADGEVVIEQVFSEVMKRIGRGDADATLEGRFGMRARTARR